MSSISRMRFANAVASASAAGLLAGCAAHPHGVLTPVAGRAPGTSLVAMTVATTREASKDPATGFTGRRGRLVSYEAIDVSIPPDSVRKVGDIQWPQSLPGDPRRDFVVSARSDLDPLAAAARVDDAAKRHPQRRVLVFVHGFNNRYEDAVYRFAQIVHDSGTADVPVLFTWPSKGSALAYGYDRESSTWSRDRLEELLARLAADKSVDHVAILAHSMGNWLTLETLRQMAIRNGRVPAKIEDVILAAPDVDVDVAREQVAAIGKAHPRFSLFTSRDDAALAFSSNVWGGRRLGSVDAKSAATRQELAAEGIAVYDLSGMGAGLNHDTFATNTDVVRAIGSRIAAGQAIDTARTPGFSDKLMGVPSSFVSGAGGLAGLAVEGPQALFDQDRREDYSSRLHDQSHGLLGSKSED